MTFCTLTNNSVHLLEVDIFIDSGSLVAAAPGSVTVQGGTSVDFEVSIRAEIGQPQGAHSVKIVADVNTVNGVASPTEEKSEMSVLTQIRQYSSLEISTNQPLLEINSGETKRLTYTVTNTGNWIDKFSFGVSGFSQDILEEIGFVVVLDRLSQEIDAGSSGVFTVSITAPYKGDTAGDEGVWEKNQDDLYDLIIQLVVTATSQYSVRTEGVPNSASATTVMTVTDPTTESIFDTSSTLIYLGAGSISVILLVILIMVIINRKSSNAASKPRAELPKQSITSPIATEELEPPITEPEDEFDFL